MQSLYRAEALNCEFCKGKNVHHHIHCLMCLQEGKQSIVNSRGISTLLQRGVESLPIVIIARARHLFMTIINIVYIVMVHQLILIIINIVYIVLVHQLILIIINIVYIVMVHQLILIIINIV